MPPQVTPRHSSSPPAVPVVGAPLPRILILVVITPVLLWIASLAVALHDPGRPRAVQGFRFLFLVHPGFDYYDYRDRMPFLHTLRFFSVPGYPWYYPAPCIFLLRPFYGLDALGRKVHAGAIAFELGALALAILAGSRFAAALMRQGVTPLSARLFTLTFLLVAWPLYFALERGNIELWIWPILAAGIWAYATGRWFLAAILLGAAGAFKLYPLFTLGLFLAARRWRPLLIGFAVAILLNLAALRYLTPSLVFSAGEIRSAVTSWTAINAVFYAKSSVGYDHAAYELLKLLTLPFHPDYPTLEKLYLPIAGAIAAGLFFCRVRLLPRTNQVLFLIATAIFLPPASFDYTLLSLLIPLGWLALVTVQQRQQRSSAPGVETAAILLALTLSPHTAFVVHGYMYGGPIKGVLLLALIGLASTLPLQDLAPFAPALHLAKHTDLSATNS